jgi:Bacterial aa3 type cytochrome c oxidase subunit IV
MRQALDADRALRYQGALANLHRAEGIYMAVETSGGHPAMDYAEHTRTYSRFIRWTIGMIVFVVLVLLFLLTLVP